jgi:hypothetical protein
VKPGELLREVVPLLSSAGIPHMVVAQQLEQFLASVDMDRFYVDPDVARDALQRRAMFNLIEMGTGWKVDLIIRKARVFSIEEMSRRQTVMMFDAQVAASTAEDTVIAKLE